MFQSWLRAYDVSLAFALRHRFATLTISIALLGATVYLFLLIPKGFLPSEDQGRFMVSTEGAQGVGFDQMVRNQRRVAEILEQDPNILNAANNFGGGFGPGGGAANSVRLFVIYRVLLGLFVILAVTLGWIPAQA